MKLTIEIDCDNAAFEDGRLTAEIQHIVFYGLLTLNNDLDDLARRDIAASSVEVALFDSNGNHVGLLTYK